MSIDLSKKKYREGGVRELWQIAFPVVISMAAYTLMQFTSRMFLAWYSTDAIAAAVPAGVTFFATICIFFGATSFCNVLTAQYFGGKQFGNVSKTFWSGIYFSVLSSVVIWLLIPVGCYLIRHSTHTLAVQKLEEEYYTMLCYAGGLTVLNNACTAFLIGVGRQKIPMLVNLGGNLLNILLSYLLILGKWGFRPLGVYGAGLATNISIIIMSIVFLIVILGKLEFKTNFQICKYWRPDRDSLIKLIRYGVPNGIGMELEITSFAVFVFLIGNVGEVSLAANNIVLTVEMLSFMPIMGVGIATSTLVGQYLGRKQPNIAKKVAGSALKVSSLYVLSLGLILIIFPQIFINLFSYSNSISNEIVEQTKILMKILAAFIFCDACNVTFASTIKGGGDTKFQMVIFILAAWAIFVPGVYITLQVLRWPIEWAWGCSVLYLFLLAVIFFFRFRSGKWLQHKIVHVDI